MVEAEVCPDHVPMIVSYLEHCNYKAFRSLHPKKIIFDLSHYAESRPGAILGGFFAWIDRKEAKE